MILEFSVENTLSIRNRQTLSFEAATDEPDTLHIVQIGGKSILKMAAIYGANASGKSNLLNAWDFYMDFILNAFTRLNPTQKTGFVPFRFDDKTVEAPGSFELTFFDAEGIRFDYLLKLDRKCVHTERLTFSPKGQKKLLFERSCENCGEDCEKLSYEYKWGDTFTGSKKKISDMTRGNVSFINTAAQLDHPEMKKVYTILESLFLPPITPETTGLFSYTIHALESGRLQKAELLKILAKADFNHISDIVVENEEVPQVVIEKLPEDVRKKLKDANGKYILKDIQVFHSYAKTTSLSINNESAGTKRMMELAGPLMEIIKHPHLLPLDEVESSLHPELLEFFIRTFLENSSQSQILFTTHSQDLLDSELMRDDEIWFAEKDETGSSGYASVVEFTGVRKGASRKKLYNAGKFGARPMITDFYKD